MLEPAQHRKNPAQSTFHSFKYHFKPESIDTRKAGKVQTPSPPRAAGDGGASLDVELLGPNSEDKHLFTAVEQATKDLDVFMIFDPTTGAFTMYEADSSVILSYDRAASKAASRSRSKTSPAAQPLPIPALPKAAPAPAAPVRLPMASTEPPAADSAKRSAVAPKAKRPKPKPVPPPKQPTPPPPPVQEGSGGHDEVIDFGPSLGGARDPPTKKGQNKSSSAARSGAAGIIFPKAAPRQHQHREPPARPVLAPPAVQLNPDPDDDEFEEIVPGVQDELETEMMKMLRESSDEEGDEDEEDEEEEDGDGGFDVQAFEQALAQEVPQDEEDTDSDDDSDSSSEDEDD
ncbi:hypothetical protein RSAG8_00907, partial [Rhizoctonia solani AG-8 WAC10335]